MDPRHIQSVAMLEDRLRKATISFSQRREFIRLNDLFDSATGGLKIPPKDPEADRDTVSLDIKDFILIGAITNSGILMSGKSGTGKSHLLQMAMNSFFGSDNYADVTITTGTNEESFIDIDFSKIKGGGMMKDAIQNTKLLSAPGVILDEVNRAPSLLQNVLIPYLQFRFNVKGLNLLVGTDIPGGGRYQFRGLTINEGAEYSGTSKMDKAVRDRMVIEIPVDQFKSTKKDIRDMVKGRKDTSLDVERMTDSKLDTILDLYRGVADIPLTAKAAELLVYLSGMSNCVRSNTGTKEGIAFTLDMCKKCTHASTLENICGNVYAPTNRSLINLQVVAKGIALVRAYRSMEVAIAAAGSDSKKVKMANKFFSSDYLANLSVGCEDIIACAPFILYSKLQVTPQWMKKHHQGNKFVAVYQVIKHAYSKFEEWYAKHATETRHFLKTGDQKRMLKFLMKYATEKDPWMANLHEFDNQPVVHQEGVADIVGAIAV